MTTIAPGTMNFGKRTSTADAEAIIERAIERGVTVFDTANIYNEGESERILGRALGKRRKDVTLASKVGMGRVGGKPEGLSKGAIERAIDGTLERLRTDYVDVYYLHTPDRATPIEEALEALLCAGKIRAWGVSNYAAWQVLEMMTLADTNGMARPVMSQVLYNALVRELDIEYFAFAKRFPIHMTIYNSLSGGVLTGTLARDATPPKGSRFDGNAFYAKRYWTPAMFARVEELRAVANAEAVSLVELAYAWVAGRSGVDSVLIGPGALEHFDAAISACEKRVSPAGLKKMDELSRTWRGTDTSYAR
jgi:aryl-alcohol dehydrogenase-like predicted oxidoreductase